MYYFLAMIFEMLGHWNYSHLTGGHLNNQIAFQAFEFEYKNYHYRYTKAAKELHNLIVESAPATTPAELAAISVPTLILNARNDMTFPPDARETMFNHIPNSKLIVYASGGHLLIQHHGAEIASDITTFFKRSQK